MKRIALKIDVDTYQGTRSGVPALIEQLQRHQAQATFFFSLGPDSNGKESRVASLTRYYSVGARLYGRFLPSPNIGSRCKEIMRRVRDAGFETGIHAWDRVAWEKEMPEAGNAVAECAMDKARQCFTEIFATEAKAHAAAGWKMSRHALRLTQRHHFAYASDCRGSHPFLPVIDGELIGCVQIPTTLPTLDEILSLEPGYSPDQAIERIHQLSCAIPGDHVFTLRAELEGMKFASAFARLLDRWNENGIRLIALRDVRSTLIPEALPRHALTCAEIPGRQGIRLAQGDVFP